MNRARALGATLSVCLSWRPGECRRRCSGHSGGRPGHTGREEAARPIRNHFQAAAAGPAERKPEIGAAPQHAWCYPHWAPGAPEGQGR